MSMRPSSIVHEKCIGRVSAGKRNSFRSRDFRKPSFASFFFLRNKWPFSMKAAIASWDSLEKICRVRSVRPTKRSFCERQQWNARQSTTTRYHNLEVLARGRGEERELRYSLEQPWIGFNIPRIPALASLLTIVTRIRIYSDYIFQYCLPDVFEIRVPSLLL